MFLKRFILPTFNPSCWSHPWNLIKSAACQLHPNFLWFKFLLFMIINIHINTIFLLAKSCQIPLCLLELHIASNFPRPNMNPSSKLAQRLLRMIFWSGSSWSATGAGKGHMEIQPSLLCWFNRPTCDFSSIKNRFWPILMGMLVPFFFRICLGYCRGLIIFFGQEYDMVGSSRKLRMGWKICPIAKSKVLAGKKGMRPEGKTHRLLDRLEKRHSKPKGWVCLFPCRLQQTLCGSPANSGTKDVAHEFAGKKTLSSILK